jgi:tetratricopeptide (TPR) repeat protein
MLTMLIGAMLAAAAEPAAWQAHMEKATELRAKGDARGAKQELEAALAAAAPKSGQAAVALNDLGLVHQGMRQYAEAEKHFWRAMELVDLRFVITPLNNLATMYLETGAYGKAERLRLEEALRKREAVLPVDPDTARLLENIAGTYFARKNLDRAEEFYRRSLAVWDKSIGRDSKASAAVLNNLAVISWNDKRYAEAETYLLRACAIYRTANGDPARVPVALANLGALYALTNRHAEAEARFREALTVSKEMFGGESVDTADILMSYSEALKRMKRKPEAKAAAARAREIRRQAPMQPLGATVDVSAFRAAERLRIK